MTGRQSPRLPSARPLPTRRAPAHEQLAIVCAICRADGTFTARNLEASTGVPASRGQLVLAFWRTCGLVERAPGRGLYKPTRAAAAMAHAWNDGDQQGLRAVRKVLQSQWFGRSTRARLAQGPALRDGLVTRLMRLSQVGDEFRLEVEMLVDLMAAVGMLVPQPDGYLAWHEERKPAAAAPTTGTGDDAGRPGSRTRPEEKNITPEPDTGVIPEPRTPADAPPASSDIEDLATLLSRPVQLADLARLSPEDLLALHGHIAGLAATATKLGSRPSATGPTAPTSLAGGRCRTPTSTHHLTAAKPRVRQKGFGMPERTTARGAAHRSATTPSHSPIPFHHHPQAVLREGDRRD